MGKILSPKLFPTCIQETTDINYGVWSLENAMKTYWRVKTWTFTANGVIRVYGYPNVGENTDFPIETSIAGIQSGYYWDQLYTSEEQLICGGGGFYLNDPENSDQYALLEFLESPKKIGNLYYSGMSGYIYDIFSMEYSFGVTPNLWSVSILGSDLPMGATLFPNEEFEEQLISLSANLTPTEWWTYGETYNPSTGNPL